MRRRAPLALLILLTTPRCSTHQCDGDFVIYNGGELVDPDTWESTPENGTWADFSGQRTWVMFHNLGREPVEMWAWISTSPRPFDKNPDGTFQGTTTLAAGNLAEFIGVDDKGLQVKNDSCAEYFVRVVVHARPVADAGADTEE